MSNPKKPYATVDQVQIIESRGPWQSKSGGTLDVRFALPREAVEAFLNYDNPEFDKIKEESGIDIRGLRCYTVSGIAKGEIGAKEWHLTRTEYVTALSGSAVWRCVDLDGNEREIIIDGKQAVLQPAGIFHIYEALEDNTTLQVICNNLFIPEDPTTHDSYTEDVFYEQLRLNRSNK